MKIISTAALVAVLVAVPLSAFAQSKAHYTTTAEDIAVTANTISITGSGSVVIQGNVNVKSVDKTTRAAMEARGTKVVLKFAPAKSKTAGAQFDSLESAEITGPATMVHTTTLPTGISKTIATADKATYSGSNMTAHLTGGVKIVQEDPMYAKPAVMTGETAVVNLDPNINPNDIMVKVDTPGGVSNIEATPTTTGYIYISAATISGMRSGNIILQDNAYLKSIDNTTKAVMEARGSRVVLKLAPAEPNTTNAQFNALQSAEITGPVTIINTTVQPTGTSKTTATADKAIYSGTDQIARLAGSVKIVQEDPMFAKPAVVTGETAMVNLNPSPGPDDITVQVDTPDGVSRVEVTPKPKEGK